MSSGLKSKVSNWLQAPEQNMTSTLFALALKWESRAANGLAGLMLGLMGLFAPKSPSRASKLATAIPPSP